MNTNELVYVSAVIIVAVLVAGSLAITAAGVAAGANNTTKTTVSTATTTTESVADRVIDVGNSLTVTDYSYADGEMRITVEADRPLLVSLMDLSGARAGGEGAQEVSFRRVSIPEGTSTITIKAGTYDGIAAVTLGSTEAVVVLRERVSSSIIGGPWDEQDAQVAGAGGLSAGLVAVTLQFLKRKRGDVPQEREL